MEIAIFICIVAVLLLNLLLFLKLNALSAIQSGGSSKRMEELLRRLQKDLTASMQSTTDRMGQQINDGQARLQQTAQQGTAQQMQQLEQRLQSLEQNHAQQQKNLQDVISQQMQLLQNQQKSGMTQSLQYTLQQLKQFEQRLQGLEQSLVQQQKNLQDTVSQQMQLLQTQQKRSLADIRNTVDEKLTKQLEDSLSRSFRRVSEQLEAVYKGLGEMQHLASGVGDLKKVLSNVKTRGILGEIQLGAILQEILTPEQYETEYSTVPGSRDHVEYAIKLPGDGERPVYLPVDSKFPGDTYYALQDAYDSGDRLKIDAARKLLTQRLRGCAKDIHDKYIAPPYTTNFAILFLPFEGLYAEVVNCGMVEQLQREFQINIAGPSTMAAMLNALQMGFRTLAIQKRSGEVWTVLGAVKTEFEKYQDTLEKVQKSLQGAEKHLDMLMHTRTNAIQRKLRSVEQLGTDETEDILGIEQLTP